MRQSLSLSRPVTVKLLRISERTLHNWETGKVRIPYAAYKLVRLFNSYELFRPIWKDWRIVGTRLITPEGHSLEAGNFHWLSLMARKSDAFSRLYREKHTQKEAEMAAKAASVSGLVLSPTSFSPQHSKPLKTTPFLVNQALTPKDPKQGLGQTTPAPVFAPRFALGLALFPRPLRRPGMLPAPLRQDFGLGGAV